MGNNLAICCEKRDKNLKGNPEDLNNSQYYTDDKNAYFQQYMSAQS
jgi:hypothetical protein